MAWVESKSVDDWLDKYVPGDNPDESFAPYDVYLGGNEHDMYPGLIKGLNRDLETVKWEGYHALNTSEHSDRVTLTRASRTSTCPDLGIYPKNTPENWLDYDPSSESDADGGVSSTMESGLSGLTDEERIADVPMRSRVAWGWAELLVEVKHEKRPRINVPQGPLPQSLQRGQLTDYANEVFNRQHRVSFFMITVLNDYARLVCFERQGAEFTPEFNYLEEPDVIGRFLSRLAKLDRAGRGYDATVKAASPEEERHFRDLHKQYHPRSVVAAGLRDAATKGWRVYNVSVDAPFSTDGTPVRRNSPLARHELLIGKPASVKGSLVGRGTRGFVAYDLTSQQVVFLKDSWRPDSEDIRSEFDNYLLITESKKIKNNLHIPTLLGGGDVKYNGVVQRTRIPTTRYHPFIHFRLILKEVCRRLEDFKNSYQLLRVVTYAFSAHRMVWEACRLLHRDVSAGNILIHNPRDNEEPDLDHVVGLLSDWDLARTEQEITSEGATQQTRSGTWPFMSTRLQRFPEKPHELADDIESFYHVLNWCTLLHLPHEFSSDVDVLAEYISRLYDFASADVPELGHPEKHKYVRDGTPFVTMRELGPNHPHPLQLVLKELASLFQSHYYHARYPPGSPPSALNVEIVTEDDSPPDDDVSSAIGLPDVPLKNVQTPANLPVTPTPRDPGNSPLCDHERVLTCLGSAIRSKIGWPREDDRIAGRRIVLAAFTGSKRRSGNPYLQLTDSVASNKRIRTGPSPSERMSAAPRLPRRTSRSSVNARSMISRSARSSPTPQSESATRSGSPITGNASPVLSDSPLQSQFGDISSAFEALRRWKENRESRPINPAIASGINEISLNSPPRSPPRMYATTTTSDPNVFSLDNPRRVYAMHTEVPLRVQHPESSQRSTQRRGDFDDADEPEEDPRAQW
ncbi:hypothetical protein L226DRAFT_539896 [Lentinus tigrinus ALCF2SS1-7]|nr:hypothetical protein L226DRAFT_539896 [Lentinus tigrinus ALCF2SS1-7]